ncbi:alpha-N-acetylglucosaminidase [Microbacterium sp. A94]|uniref:alpha-N-acetylglucosaminidase n=1 Tax=Microbacterium sp. A94 TaxID=3450717 RepID=UPI003F444399
MNTQTASESLLHRLLGEGASDFRVEIDPQTGGDEDSFAVSASDGIVTLRGTNGVAIASALRFYLSSACGLQIARDTGAVELPARLPDFELTERTSPWEHRYHMNFCTFSYTTAFWDWERWEREVDLMALHGINLPLNVVGNEGVWYRVFQDFGMSEEEVLAFMGSAAFLPFTWHGSVRYHGGPMTVEWIDSHVELGQRIMDRQRSLGMKPVLPGFAGYVPEILKGETSFEVEWMDRFNYVLGTDDPTFEKLGSALLREQERLFGSDGYYAIDPFIEGLPQLPAEDGVEPGAAMVAKRAAQITKMLTGHNPAAVWVLMSWAFQYRTEYWTPARITAALNEMPVMNTLIQDTWGEHSPVWDKTEEFEGRPWVWTMLHNFGGRPGMHGALDLVANEPFRILNQPARSMAGIGLSPEALDHDPVAYELMADAVWRREAIDLDTWIDDYARIRYGRLDDGIREAWRILLREVYTHGERTGPVRSVIMCRPRVEGDLAAEWTGNTTEDFEPKDLSADMIRAWELLIEAALADGATPGLERDIVDLGLEVLSRTANGIQIRARSAFVKRDRAEFDAAAGALLDSIRSMDELADRYPGYRFRTWLDAARGWATSEAEEQILVHDATLINTSWFAPGLPIQDYAGKHWSGLISGYYGERWARWVHALEAAWESELDVDAFNEQLSQFEAAWQHAPKFEEPVSERVLDTAVRLREWNRAVAAVAQP